MKTPDILPFVCTLMCGLATAGLLAAEWRAWSVARGVCKCVASAAFVGVAISLGALGSHYGTWVVTALVLGAVGDVCLLWQHSAAFLAGLGAFLLAHLAYAVAFASAEWVVSAACWGLLLMTATGAFTLRWLWPHLRRLDRVAVSAYVAAIVVMCALSLGYSARLTASPWVAVAALAFAASDLAVARQRFVRPALVNRLWGLPTYYAAQLTLAWSAA